MHPIAILHEVKNSIKVNDRLESLAELYPVVSGALITISGSVRNTATLLEVMIANENGAGFRIRASKCLI
jgi:hypothetical protein